jgi:DNA-binding transcriptional MerR regulator
MQEQALYSIGRLAELSGLPVKTIRYYSDIGILPPAARTDAGHRRYGDGDLARLQLVRSLRQLGLDLVAAARLVEGRDDLREILAAHARTLEARLHSLQRQLAVARAAAAGPTESTLARLLQLISLDERERRRLLEDFWGGRPLMSPRPFATIDGSEGPALGVVELPTEPTLHQLDAWLELAMLVTDEDFQRVTAANAAWGAQLGPALTQTVGLVQHVRKQKLTPEAAEAGDVVGKFARACSTVFERRDSPEFRAWLADQVQAHTDPRGERYWQLSEQIRGHPRGEATQSGSRGGVFPWLIQALRAHAESSPAPKRTPRRRPSATGDGRSRGG